MTTSGSTYSFLPWLRKGLGISIEKPADGEVRAKIPVTIELSGDPMDTRVVQLYGPGDILGIERRAIVRTEPRDKITNFEPNQLAFVEFYDEDMPWRYTPAVPDTNYHRLQPWIMLVVLKEGEFGAGDKDETSREAASGKGRPLPFITINDTRVLPDPEELWAWAHVHVNRSLDDAETVHSDLTGLQSLLKENPDLAYSRILCPRKLEENTAYHAFVIPVYEIGRMAGLGEYPTDPAAIATKTAWPLDEASQNEESEKFKVPYYYRWYFRTGTVGDFEYLVRLLEPKPVDPRVGTREMDVQDPGPNLPGIPDLGGVLRLGGALRAPIDTTKPEGQAAAATAETYDKWAEDFPHPFQTALAALINLGDDYAAQGTADPDPVVTPPLYGRWHGMAQRLLVDREENSLRHPDNWVHELNLDPRYRVTAGFGTKVIQERQEEYMEAAWQQVGEILEANRRIRLAQLAKETAWMWYDRHVLPLGKANLERVFSFMAPLHKRVLADGETVFHRMRSSRVTPAVTSVAMRRAIRPKGRTMRSLSFTAKITPDNLLARIDAGEVSAAPPKTTPSGVVTVQDLSDALLPKDIAPLLLDLLRRYPWLMYLPVVLIVLIALLLYLSPASGQLQAAGAAAIAALTYLFRRLWTWVHKIEQAESVLGENQTPDSVDELPKSADFILSAPGQGVRPTYGNQDGEEAKRFKEALKDVNALLVAGAAAGVEPERGELGVAAMVDAGLHAINPERTIPRRVKQGLDLPSRIKGVVGEGNELREAMVYPELDVPMYAPLSDVSPDLFLPNLHLISQNCISLLESNQKFIESYMVGLNHEFSRELLWREFPTDQRGSYFRQFWDVSSYLTDSSVDPESLKESLKDIPPLHRWATSPGSPYHSHPRPYKLGDFDNRGRNKDEEVVLVIRGELLKRYPTAVIYAQKAEWQLKNGSIDKTQERRLVTLDATEEDNPPRTKIKTPLYSAKIEPDIYFLGFDLTVAEAKGGTGDNPSDIDKPGWFFVIKERPGEPRFGLDVKKREDGRLYVWNDLSWDEVRLHAWPRAANRPEPKPVNHLKAAQSVALRDWVPAPAAGSYEAWEKENLGDQRDEDLKVPWHSVTNAAQLAYILIQVPVRVAIHAAEMLRKT